MRQNPQSLGFRATVMGEYLKEAALERFEPCHECGGRIGYLLPPGFPSSFAVKHPWRRPS